MKRINIRKPVFHYLPLIICSLFFAACNYEGWPTEPINSFSYDLQGEWVSHDISVYCGRLEIDFNTIKISGYFESQVPAEGNPDQRPFKDFTKNVQLESYSELVEKTNGNKKGNIYIKNAGTWQDSIPYTFWEVYSGGEYVQFLRFEFGGRKETLSKISD